MKTLLLSLLICWCQSVLGQSTDLSPRQPLINAISQDFQQTGRLAESVVALKDYLDLNTVCDKLSLAGPVGHTSFKNGSRRLNIDVFENQAGRETWGFGKPVFSWCGQQKVNRMIGAFQSPPQRVSEQSTLKAHFANRMR